MLLNQIIWILGDQNNEVTLFQNFVEAEPSRSTTLRGQLRTVTWWLWLVVTT